MKKTYLCITFATIISFKRNILINKVSNRFIDSPKQINTWMDEFIIENANIATKEAFAMTYEGRNVHKIKASDIFMFRFCLFSFLAF